MNLNEIISRLLTTSTILAGGECIPSPSPDDHIHKTKKDLISELQNSSARLSHIGRLLHDCYDSLATMRFTSYIKLYECTKDAIKARAPECLTGSGVCDEHTIHAIVCQAVNDAGIFVVCSKIDEGDFCQILKEAAGFWQINNTDIFAKEVLQAFKSKYPNGITISFDE